MGHTPGPWVANRDEASPNRHGNSYFWITPVEQTFEKDYLCTNGWMKDENAHLIAAAPEMLEALKLALNSMAGNNNPFDLKVWSDAVDAVSAAVKKAQGEK